MKKTILSSILVLLFGSYAFYKHDADILTNNKEQNPLPLVTTFFTSETLYRDGKYSGKVADAYYGNIQVEATIVANKITDVKFLQYPNERQNSIRLNIDAMPKLQTEAIVAQKADVDGITGASLTSAAFIESLSGALAQAKI